LVSQGDYKIESRLTRSPQKSNIKTWVLPLLMALVMIVCLLGKITSFV
jgi:hypothetical protein